MILKYLKCTLIYIMNRRGGEKKYIWHPKPKGLIYTPQIESAPANVYYLNI